jgi:hypothetical protein
VFVTFISGLTPAFVGLNPEPEGCYYTAEIIIFVTFYYMAM